MTDARVQMPDEKPGIVLTDAPAPVVKSSRCPRCGAGKDVRVPSAGFGDPHPVCSRCGYEFYGERMDG